MTRNLRGGKGITHCRLPYGHVTLIAYYSIADRQPVVRCNWRRANWTWVSRILARTDDKRGWKTRNKSSLCRWQFRLIPFGGRVASGTAEETSRRNGSRLPHAPPPPPVRIRCVHLFTWQSCSSSFSQWLAQRMNRWDRYSSRNHQIESTSRTEPELSSNARQEETPNRISFGFVLTEALLGMFLDWDRYLSEEIIIAKYLFSFHVTHLCNN